MEEFEGAIDPVEYEVLAERARADEIAVEVARARRDNATTSLGRLVSDIVVRHTERRAYHSGEHIGIIEELRLLDAKRRGQPEPEST